MKTRWTPKDDRALIRMHAKKTAAQIAEKLGRTVSSVTSRAHVLGLRKQRRRREFKRRYPNEPTAQIAADMGRTVTSLYVQAGALGLHKSRAYMAGPGPHKFSGEEGREHRFRKGDVPWNAGKKGWKAGGRSARTRFKKGHKPQTWVPVGTEVIDSDGYLKRKVRDDAPPGMSRHNWKFVHVLVWEEANGAVPPGHNVVFRDRNSANIALENLECITRQENMRRNSVHNLPKELAQVVQLRGAVNRLIRGREPHSRESAQRSVMMHRWRRTNQEASKE